MKKQSSKSVLILYSLLLMAIMTSCNSLSSKDAKNKVYTTNSVGVSGNEKAELYGGNLSGFKGRASSDGNNASSNINIPRSATAPTASISEVDIDNLAQRQVTKASISGVNLYNQSQSKTFKTSNVDNLALQHNTSSSDINSTLKARTTESGVASTSTKAKTTAAGKKVIQKGSGPPTKPGEPGFGSLPVGDGTWVLLLILGMYATRKIIKEPILKEYLHF